MPDEKNTEETGYETEENECLRPVRDRRQQYKELRRLRKEQRRDKGKQSRPSRSIFWGLMLILWAILIILTQQKLIPVDDLWKYFLIGLGSIFIIQAIVSSFNYETRSYAVGRLIPGFILLFIGTRVYFKFQ